MTSQRPIEPGEIPPRGRRLERPPSERYRTARPAAEPEPKPARLFQTVALAVALGLAGAAAIIVLGGLFAVDVGLVVVAIAVGRFVGLAIRPAPLRGAGRVAIAVAIALGAIVLGQAGLWLYARTEGGVLDPIDYLAQVFGLVAPAEAVLAAGLAWWSAR